MVTVTFRAFKYALIATNFLTMLSGLVLIGVGARGLAGMDASTGTVFNTQALFGGEIGVGLIAIMLSLLGIVGSIKESPRSLKVYFALLFILFFIQIVIGSVAAARSNDLPAAGSTFWQQTAQMAPGTLKSFELRFSCCGYSSITDQPVPADCSTNPNFGFQTPCYDAVINSAKSNLVSIAAAAITFGLLQLFSLVASAVLFRRFAAEREAYTTGI